jgi:hypothetical protein
MHPHFCDCDPCLNGTPAKPTRKRSPKERKRAQNARAYLRRKLRDV